MGRLETVRVDGRSAHVVFSNRSDGDFRPVAPPSATPGRRGGVPISTAALAERRRRIVSERWTWLRQVHGARVVTVASAGGMAGAEADGAVTTASGSPLAVTTADCAPVVLVAEGGVAVVHAGWRGLVSGVVQNAASQLRAIGGQPVASFVGPCISPLAYEFGPDDLDLAARALGEDVRAETAWGTPALDVPAAVSGICRRLGWPPPRSEPACTSDERWYSHRTRTDLGRQVTVAWLSDDGAEVSADG